MKIGSLPSYFAVALLSFLGFFSVHSLDQVLQYQDAHSLKGKLPFERLDEFHLHERHRRAADPIKNATVDDHKYYKSIYTQNATSDWFELSDHPEKIKDLYLSSGYLKSKNLKFQFTFPYYGHPITNATVTTGGFLYVGYVETSLITQVMYVAPFMAPFNPSLKASAAIYYFSNATQFTVQWTNLHLSNNENAGPFTFQVSLYKDGRIRFAYKMIPLTPLEVFHMKPVPQHPVKVGISDAFFGYRTLYDMRRREWKKIRIFYVYHKVNKTMNIKSNGSALLLLPVKTCVAGKSCGECTNLTKVSQFKCAWCSKLQRCSDSLDRHRVEWFSKSCDKTAIKEYQKCSSADGNSDSSSKKTVYSSQRSSGISTGAVAAIVVSCLVLIIVIAIGAWCFFAYTHPVTPSGLFLIELRNKPAQLFKRNESGTTVAGATSSASRA